MQVNSIEREKKDYQRKLKPRWGYTLGNVRLTKANMVKYAIRTCKAFLLGQEEIQPDKSDYFYTRWGFSVVAAIPSGQVQQEYIYNSIWLTVQDAWNDSHIMLQSRNKEILHCHSAVQNPSIFSNIFMPFLMSYFFLSSFIFSSLDAHARAHAHMHVRCIMCFFHSPQYTTYKLSQQGPFIWMVSDSSSRQSSHSNPVLMCVSTLRHVCVSGCSSESC